jgi:hypothetical protein
MARGESAAHRRVRRRHEGAPVLRAAAGVVLLVSLALTDAARAQFAPPGRPGERGLDETRPPLPEFGPPRKRER